MSARDISEDELFNYLVQAVRRTSGIYGERSPDDPAYALALGEAVALFNLADEFGLIENLRKTVDEQAGFDVYRRLSEAMKAYYLGGSDRPASQPRGSAIPRGQGQRQAGGGRGEQRHRPDRQQSRRPTHGQGGQPGA